MEHEMAEGIYGVRYWQDSGEGVGILVLRRGRILGYDIGGGVYSGTYEARSDGHFDAKVTLEGVGGLTLVTGHVTPEDGEEIPIEFTVQKYPGPTEFEAATPYGPVKYQLDRLQSASWLDPLTS